MTLFEVLLADKQLGKRQPLSDISWSRSVIRQSNLGTQEVDRDGVVLGHLQAAIVARSGPPEACKAEMEFC
jgi:hypothetical protein